MKKLSKKSKWIIGFSVFVAILIIVVFVLTIEPSRDGTYHIGNDEIDITFTVDGEIFYGDFDIHKGGEETAHILGVISDNKLYDYTGKYIGEFNGDDIEIVLSGHHIILKKQ